MSGTIIDELVAGLLGAALSGLTSWLAYGRRLAVLEAQGTERLARMDRIEGKLDTLLERR